MQVFQYDVSFGHQLQQFHGEAEERGGFLGGVGAADVGHGGGAVAEGGFVDGETLFLPVVGGEDAVADRLFEEVDGVLVVDLGAGVAAVVEEAAGVGLVGCHEGS